MTSHGLRPHLPAASFLEQLLCRLVKSLGEQKGNQFGRNGSSTASMARIKHYELGISELQKHPVWTWFYGDLEEPENMVVPVEMTEEGLAEADVLMIYSQFKTAAGNEHDGYVVFDPDLGEVFAINIFVPGCRIPFNIRLADLAPEQLQQYAKATGYSASDVLPIKYRTRASLLDVVGEFGY